METKKRMQRFLSIFLACIMTLNVPMSSLAFDDVMVLDAVEDLEVYAEQEEMISGEAGDTEEEGSVIVISEDESTIEGTTVGNEQTEAADENASLVEEQSAEGFEITGIETMSEDPGLAKAEDPTPASDAEVYVTVSVKGVPAQAKDGGAMLDRSVTVKDINQDGKLTYDEALTAAHDAYYEGGAAAGYGSEKTDAYGLSLTKLWGDTSKAYGYWKNDASCWNLDDEVNDGDSLNAFVYQDAANYSDAYIRFDNATYLTPIHVVCSIGLEKAVWDNESYAYVFQNCSGAVFSVYDKAGKPVSTEDYTVSEEGILFKKTGTYYLVASGSKDQLLVPTAAKVVASKNPSAELKGIKLDYESRTVPAEKDNYTLLKATLEPADLTGIAITWTSSNPEVAKVEGGKVCALSPGTTVITASAGNFSAQCTYKVTEPPRLSAVKWYTDSNAYNAKADPLKMTPAFEEKKQNGYTITAPDYLSSIYVEGTIAPEFLQDGYNMIFYLNNYGTWSGYRTNESGVGKYSSVISGNKTSIFANRAYRYEFNLARYTTLTKLVTDGRMQGAFDKNTNTYKVMVDQYDGNAFGVTPTAYKDTYGIKVNGIAVKSGEKCEVPFTWDEQGKMTVSVEVSAENLTTSTYTLELEKTNFGSAPAIQNQLESAEYLENETAKALTVEALTNGALSYQWYVSTTESTENGTAIDEATEKSYTPSTETKGTFYYYCVVTNTKETAQNTSTTNLAKIVVNTDPTPIATLNNPGTTLSKAEYDYAWEKGYVYQVGDTATPLTVTASTKETDEGAVLSYEWKKLNKAYADSVRATALDGEITGTSYVPQTTLAEASNTGAYYGCQVTCTYKDKKYTSWAKTGETYTVGEGENAKTYDVIGVYVFTKTDKADKPEITRQPNGKSYKVGDWASRMYSGASVKDGGTLTYQWYVNDTNSNENGTAIANAKQAFYSIGEVKEAGTKYYYCVATNTNQGYTASTASETAEIIVTESNAGSGEEGDEIGLSGKGTKEEPYLIKTAQDYITVADKVAEGTSFAGKYLRQERNITLPKGWEPIGVTKDRSDDIQSGANLWPFSGILDGNGKTVTVPEGGLPLLGYVKNAEVRNLKIYGKKIAGYGLVNNYVGVGLSGSAIVIDNVTLKSGSSTLKSGLIGTYITTNGYAGCSATYMATVRNCTIEDGVVIGYQKDQSMIGSIAGRFQGTIENCVSHADVYGVDYVGGIAATVDNAMSGLTVKDCTFDGTVTASGEYAGGIVGGGYSNSTAPNGNRPTIINCKAGGSVSGADKVGGILGGDGYVAQNWSANTVKGNAFTGTVRAVGTYVGGIIGYYNSLNKNDIIVSNYYSASCGAAKGIGFIKYIDTNYAKPTESKGTVYFNTENGTDGCPEVTGAYWHEQLNRTDDPLGVHAKKLASTNPNQEPEVINLIVAGDYKKTYYAGEKFDTTGMTVTAEWSNDTTTPVKLENLTINDSAMSEKGWKNVVLTYQGITASVTVRVLTSIKVTFSLLGDSKHDSDKDGKVHTLADENLEIWVPETIYYVSPDATVYDILLKAAEQYGFVMIGDTQNDYNTMYIEGITWTYPNGTKITLSELDNGPKSGWMDVVNGLHPNVGVERQTLKNNDVIIFHYTDDYTVEESKMFDQSQADEITELIAALPVADKLTVSDKAAVQAAREAYEALTASQKELVSAETLKQLEAAEARIAELEKKPHAHSWDTETVTKAATCTATGVKTYTCDCGESKTETIPALGHKFGAWTTVSEATVKAAEVQKQKYRSIPALSAAHLRHRTLAAS